LMMIIIPTKFSLKNQCPPRLKLTPTKASSLHPSSTLRPLRTKGNSSTTTSRGTTATCTGLLGGILRPATIKIRNTTIIGPKISTPTSMKLTSGLGKANKITLCNQAARRAEAISNLKERKETTSRMLINTTGEDKDTTPRKESGTNGTGGSTTLKEISKQSLERYRPKKIKIKNKLITIQQELTLLRRATKRSTRAS